MKLTREQDTEALATAFCDGFSRGDTILLSGDIGAGKSFFARAVIRNLLARFDVVEDIPSPTFTLVQTYQAGDLEIWHSDLYRLSTVDEVFELGLIDAFSEALCLVEWPDRLADLAPPSALSLHFDIPEDLGQRDLTVSARDPKWDWVKVALQNLSTDRVAADG